MLYGLLTTDYFYSNLNVAHLPRVEGESGFRTAITGFYLFRIMN
ncbi:hypothetical protein B4092_0968 [Bacillus licheniformis]|nr:hypothetical protein B4092_0968 [Bacillus licheniformis]TWJ64611.1 hypothetical protein CHCC5020_3867 [Bacillus licheniformis]TWN47725.1 hypothetical protein CHCC14441_0015 [Bacillus licheniformis]TWO01079.1 hypothetical protein CHCC20486_2684 [Bacillus licheniformis]